MKANILICKAITAKENIPEGHGQDSMWRWITPQRNIEFHVYYFYMELITFNTMYGDQQSTSVAVISDDLQEI